MVQPTNAGFIHGMPVGTTQVDPARITPPARPGDPGNLITRDPATEPGIQTQIHPPPLPEVAPQNSVGGLQGPVTGTLGTSRQSAMSRTGRTPATAAAARTNRTGRGRGTAFGTGAPAAVRRNPLDPALASARVNPQQRQQEEDTGMLLGYKQPRLEQVGGNAPPALDLHQERANAAQQWYAQQQATGVPQEQLDAYFQANLNDYLVNGAFRNQVPWGGA